MAADVGLVRPPVASTSSGDDRGEYQAVVLPAGWVLVECRLSGNGVVADGELLKRLSQSGSVVGCDEESHVMYSAASEWREGREIWSVVHSSEKARDHLAITGVPPDGWTKIRDEFLEQQHREPQGDVDCIYEIPLTVAEHLVGYRSDSEAAASLEFVTLLPGPPMLRRRRATASVLRVVLLVLAGLIAWTLRRVRRTH
jgi:hypothetical protein